MKLFLYELLKLYKKKSIVTLIPLLLLINGWVFVQQELGNHKEIIENREDYLRFETPFLDLNVEQAYNKALNLREELMALQNYHFIQQNNDIDSTYFFQSEEELQYYSALYEESEYADNEPLLLQHNMFISAIIEKLEGIKAFPIYVEKIEEQAENMLQYSIFNNPNSFSYRNIVKTTQDFEQVKELPLQFKYGAEYGVVSGTTYRLTDMMVLSILVILIIFVFHTEREQGQLQLINTMKHGRIKLFAAKLLIVIVLAIVCALLFYGSIMLLANRLYGFGDGSRYIQSIKPFIFSNLPLTVQQYLIWFIIGKMVICMMITLLLTFIMLFFKHLSKSLLVIVLLVSGSYMAYHFIDTSSYLNLLKYMNIMALLDVSFLITNYVNLNLLGYPITYLHLSFIFTGGLVLILVVGCSYVYTKSTSELSKRSVLRWPLALKSKCNWMSARLSTVSLFIHEARKQLWTAKGWFILLVALFISIQDINNAKIVLDNNQYYYNQYMQKLSGPLTEEKMESIENEWYKRNNVGNELQKFLIKYEAGEITFEQYLAAQGEIEQLQQSMQAFNKIYQNYQYLLEQKQNEGIDVYFVHEYTANYIFNNTNRDQMNVMILGLLLTIYLSSVYTVDSKLHMLLKTMKQGRFRLFSSVWLFGIAISIIILGIIYSAQYINASRLYPAIEWQAPIQSLQQFSKIDSSITLGQLVIIVSVCQCIGVAAISTIFLLLAQLLKRFSLTLLTGILIILWPTVMSWLGFNGAIKYTLHYPQLMFTILGRQSLSEVITYYILIVMFMFVCLWFTWNYYITGSVWGRTLIGSGKKLQSIEGEVDFS